MAQHIITAGWLYNDDSLHRALDFRAAVGTPIYAADAGTLSTRIYGAERVYGNTSAWGGNGTFTLNGSQWVSITSGSTSYSECGAVAIYRV